MLLKRRQWNNLLEALENGSCIILLGPMVSTVDKSGISLAAQFAKELSAVLTDEEVEYDKAEELNLSYIMQRFMTVDGVTSSDPGYEAKKFFKKHNGAYNTVQKLIAELPVSLVINTSPDDGIVQALKQAGKYQTIHNWYNYGGEASPDIETPTVEKPLVYNLFGYYEDPESLVLTEADQLKFVSNVVKDQPPLPPKLLRQFQGKKSFLFLGFDWENWSLRILLQSLQLEKESGIFAHSRHDASLQHKTQNFYESHFNFSFVSDNIEAIVRELHERFQDHAVAEVSQKKLVIISDPKDEAYRDELHLSLKSLPLESWHEGLLMGGEDVTDTFKQQLENADIVLLLISKYFFASDDIQSIKWPLVLDQYQHKKSTVIPVITSPCTWQENIELTRMSPILPVANQDVGKPISSWDNPDDAYQMIIQEIKNML